MMQHARLSILLLGLASAAGANTFYVAPGGSDRGAGSAAAPFATLQAGVNAAASGDTVLVRDGAYGPGGAGSMGVTVNKTGITLRAEHPGSAVLDCRMSCSAYINLGPASTNVTIQGFDIRNGLWAGIFSNSMGGKNVVVRGNTIHHIGNRPEGSGLGIMGIYTDAGASGWTIDGNTFHDIGRTSHLTGTHDHAIYAHGNATTITNNVFYGLKNGWHVQTAEGFSGTISHNTFYGPDPGAQGQVMLWGRNGSLAIRNNVFQGAKPPAIVTYGLTMAGGCSVDHNLAFTPGAKASIFSAPPKGCQESAESLDVDPKLADPTGGGAQQAGYSGPVVGAPAQAAAPAKTDAPAPRAPAAPKTAAAPAPARQATTAKPAAPVSVPKPAAAPTPKLAPAPAPEPVPKPALAPRAAPATRRGR